MSFSRHLLIKSKQQIYTHEPIRPPVSTQPQKHVLNKYAKLLSTNCLAPSHTHTHMRCHPRRVCRKYTRAFLCLLTVFLFHIRKFYRMRRNMFRALSVYFPAQRKCANWCVVKKLLISFQWLWFALLCALFNIAIFCDLYSTHACLSLYLHKLTFPVAWGARARAKRVSASSQIEWMDGWVWICLRCLFCQRSLGWPQRQIFTTATLKAGGGEMGGEWVSRAMLMLPEGSTQLCGPRVHSFWVYRAYAKVKIVCRGQSQPHGCDKQRVF